MAAECNKHQRRAAGHGRAWALARPHPDPERPQHHLKQHEQANIGRACVTRCQRQQASRHWRHDGSHQADQQRIACQDGAGWRTEQVDHARTQGADGTGWKHRHIGMMPCDHEHHSNSEGRCEAEAPAKPDIACRLRKCALAVHDHDENACYFEENGSPWSHFQSFKVRGPCFN